MQAVILAAGKGARLRPLTNTIPKPLLQVGGVPLLEHALNALPSSINEIFIVVNHLREQIIEHVGNKWNNIPVRYVVQEPLNGTAGAVLLLKEHLQDSFLVINSDDLYEAADLEQLVSHPRSILVQTDGLPREAAAQMKDETFIGLAPGETVVCGAYVLDESFFQAQPVEIQVSSYKELGLPQTLATIAKNITIHAVEAHKWTPVGTPEQLNKAQKQYI